MPIVIPTSTSAFNITLSNWQSMAAMEQLRLADSERNDFALGEGNWWQFWETKDIVGNPLFDQYTWENALADGTENDTLQNNKPAQSFNAQEYRFINGLQYDIEYVFPFIYGYSQPTDYEDLDALFNQTLNQWRLNYSSFEKFCEHCGGSLFSSPTDWGFRRCTGVDLNGNPIFTRGACEPGDILGFWLIEDIVLAFQNCEYVAFDARFHPNKHGLLISAENLDINESKKITIDKESIFANLVFNEVETPDYALQPGETGYLETALKLILTEADVEAGTQTITTIYIGGFGNGLFINGVVVKVETDDFDQETDPVLVSGPTKVISFRNKLNIQITPPDASATLSTGTISGGSIKITMSWPGAEESFPTQEYTLSLASRSGNRIYTNLKMEIWSHVWSPKYDELDLFTRSVDTRAEFAYAKKSSVKQWLGTHSTTPAYYATEDLTIHKNLSQAREVEFDHEEASAKSINGTPKHAYAYRKLKSGSADIVTNFIGSTAQPAIGSVAAAALADSATTIHAGFDGYDENNTLEGEHEIRLAWVEKGIFSNGTT